MCRGYSVKSVTMSKWLELIYVEGVYYNLYQGTGVGLFTYWGCILIMICLKGDRVQQQWRSGRSGFGHYIFLAATFFRP